MQLGASILKREDGRSYLGRISEDVHLPLPLRENEILLLRDQMICKEEGFRGIFRIGKAQARDEIEIPPALAYLAEGDIVRVNEGAGELRVLYRRSSKHNVLFFTERCNSRCLMCSQPPRQVEDGYLIDDILESLGMMCSSTPVLCITGGEPTLLGHRLIEVMEAVRHFLPDTALHMLSNGRSFAYAANAKAVASVGLRDFMIGIPLYSDTAATHDFVVQAKGAFDQTIRGLINLARFKVPVEIRFVIHKQTVGRMVETARFIARNLPFVSQVALMGLEMTGYTRSNLEALWVDPWSYRNELQKAIEELELAGIRAMIYNLPLCLVPQELWRIAQQSISDWKNVLMPSCEPCRAKHLCAGFFASATLKYSEHISPILDDDQLEAASIICSSRSVSVAEIS